MAHLIWPNDANFFLCPLFINKYYSLPASSLSLSLAHATSLNLYTICLRWLNLLICANHAEHSLKILCVCLCVSVSVLTWVHWHFGLMQFDWTCQNMARENQLFMLLCICMIVCVCVCCVFARLMLILWKPQNHLFCIELITN